MLERAKTEDGFIFLPDYRQVYSTWTPNAHEPYIGEKTQIITKPLHFFGDFPQITPIEDGNLGSYQGDEEEEEVKEELDNEYQLSPEYFEEILSQQLTEQKKKLMQKSNEH